MGKVDALKERLARADEVRFAFLFGSRADGRPRSDSDWDVGVFLAEDLPPSERFALRLRLQADLEEVGRVDLVVLNDAPPLLAQRALQGTRLIVKDPSVYLRFFVRVLGESGDERFWRELHRRTRVRRLEEGRFGRP